MKIETQVIHEKNLKLAKTILLSEGELLCSLMEMKAKRLFDDLECTGIFRYCLDYLNFSESQAFYFQKIAEAARTVPELKEAVVKGELSVSKARRITKVITPENQATWITNAKFMKQKELEKAVSIARPQELPPERIKPIAQNVSELRVAIDDETDKDLEVLKNLLSQKLKRAATLSDVIRWAAKETRNKFDPEKKAERAGKKLSLGKSRPAASGTLASNPTAGRTPIPAAIKYALILKSGFQCAHLSQSGQRCQMRKWLDAHHILPVAKGGVNTLQNLQFLCAGHHRGLHRSTGPDPIFRHDDPAGDLAEGYLKFPSRSGTVATSSSRK